MAYFGASVVVNWALSQVGYKEGANNWNKYAQELDSIGYFAPQKKQGVAWCSVFCDDAVYNSTGKDKSKTYSVLYQPSKDNLSASCKYAAEYYRAAGAWYKTAKVGDQVFFGSEGSETHTGIVVSVGVSTITTVEGNKGNAVKKCLYNKTDSKIAGYGRPRYDSEPQPQPTPTPTPAKDEYTVKTNSGDSLRLRAKATTSSKQVGYIPNGKTIKAEAIVKGENIGGCSAWVKTTYNGSQGYASGKYLTPTPQVEPDPQPQPTPPPTPKGKKYKCTCSKGVNIRSGAGANYKKVGAVNYGQIVTIYSTQNGWGNMTTNGDKWVCMKYFNAV